MADEHERQPETLQRLLLDVARLDHGMFQVEVQPLDVVELLRDIGQTLSTAERPVLVRVQADEQVVAAADPHHARQCVENLLSNALKHSPEHGASRDGRRAGDRRRAGRSPGSAAADVRAVRDGIAEIRRRRPRALSGETGRAVARRKLESAPGKGARFTLTLPIHEDPSA